MRTLWCEPPSSFQQQPSKHKTCGAPSSDEGCHNKQAASESARQAAPTPMPGANAHRCRAYRTPAALPALCLPVLCRLCEPCSGSRPGTTLAVTRSVLMRPCCWGFPTRGLLPYAAATVVECLPLVRPIMQLPWLTVSGSVHAGPVSAQSFFAISVFARSFLPSPFISCCHPHSLGCFLRLLPVTLQLLW